MARRKRTRNADPSGVQAIFDPAGDIHVRAVAPSGNVYAVAPRASFHIATEDVDWFFHEWEAQHRRCLSCVAEYQPRRAQFDNGEMSRTARVVVEPEPPVAPEPAVEPEREPTVESEPVLEPEPPVGPDPVVKADGDDESEKTDA